LARAGYILHSPAAAGVAIPGIMKWLLYLVILLALLIGTIFLIGYALPAKTTASRSISLQQPLSDGPRHSPRCDEPGAMEPQPPRR
jgi:hypothetical protein